jgi:hypothetical protein
MLRYKSLITSLESTTEKLQQEKYTESRAVLRGDAIAQWLQTGGQLFVDWIQEHYRTNTGEKLKWDEPFFEEYCLLMGHPWSEKIVTEKSAQIGYTEVLIALSAFCLGKLRIPIGLGFEERQKLQLMVAQRVQPSFDFCVPLQELTQEQQKTVGRKDTNTKATITIAGVPLTMFYAGTNNSRNVESMDYQAPSSQRSFTAYGIFADEFGLWPKGALDAMEDRMNSSPLPTKILRAGSTPAQEGGIVDREVRKSKYLFEWEIVCPHCGERQFLDAFGNFLMPIETEDEGVVEVRYVDQLGYPLQFFKDSSEFGSSQEEIDGKACIGCFHCWGKLTWEDVTHGRFVCKNTQIPLRELLADSLKRQKPINGAIAIRLPRLASRFFDPLKMIEKMYSTDNPPNTIQQSLGKAITLGGGKISLNRIKNCIGLAVPFDRKPDIVVCGIDQGRYGNPYLVQHWWFKEEDPDREKMWKDAHVEIKAWGLLGNLSTDIDELVERWDIDVVAMDNEPEYDNAVDYSLSHLPDSGGYQSWKSKGQVYLFDQIDSLKGKKYNRTERIVGEVKDPRIKRPKRAIIYSIDRTYYLDRIRYRVYRKQQHFPSRCHYDPSDKNNLILHYVTSDRVLINGVWRWVEPSGMPDHFHHCDAFANAAVHVSFYEPGRSRYAIANLED